MDNEQADAGRDSETLSRDQILWRERGQGNIHFPCSADHEQDWQPYPVDPYSCYIRACIHTLQPSIRVENLNIRGKLLLFLYSSRKTSYGILLGYFTPLLVLYIR